MLAATFVRSWGTAMRSGAAAMALALAGVALAAGPGASRADAAEQLSVRLDWSTHAIHAPFFLAKERGWYEDAGLDVQIEDGNGSTTTVQLVGSGQFDIGHASLAPMAIAKGAGLPVIAIAGFLRKGDMGVLVPVESDIRDPKDLEGKKVVYTAGSLEGPFLEPFFANNGSAASKVGLLNVEAASKVSTYLSGNADAVISTVPFILPIAEGKRTSRGILFADHGLALPGFGLVVQRSALEEKGAAVKKFATIVSGAWGYILNGHEDEGVEAILANRPNAPLTREVLRKQIDTYREFFYTDATKGKPVGVQTDADWRQTIANLEEAGVVKKGSQPADYYTNDYLDAAEIERLTGAK